MKLTELNRREQILFALVALLLVPAFFTNLGLLAFIDDEAIRSLVALEMKISGNYIAPTIHGDFYYRKPPLFNWILVLGYQLFGWINEWTTRMPTVFFLMVYGAVIWFFGQKTFGGKRALINALLFITCGRILFWDSMLGLIDITFSLVMYLLFMVIYHLEKKEQPTTMFLLAYFLSAVGYLLKGLPALVFIGITLSVWLVYRKKWRLLLSWSHAAGLLVLITMLGVYYGLYAQVNTTFLELGSNLFDESARRTVVNYGLGKTVLHLFTFPFEMVYHFLPWSLMLIYFIRKDTLSLIQEDSFILYNLLIFLANIVLYWTSPEVYPRYLLMHAPLIFSVYYFLHLKHAELRTWQWHVFNYLFGGILVLLALGSLAPIFLDRSRELSGYLYKTLGLFLLFSFLAYWYWRWEAQRLLITITALLLFRLGFDWFVLPDRNANDFANLCRQDAIRIGEKFADETLYLDQHTFDIRFAGFYISEITGKILFREKPVEGRDTYFIFDKEWSPEMLAYPIVDSLRIRRDNRYIYVAHTLRKKQGN